MPIRNDKEKQVANDVKYLFSVFPALLFVAILTALIEILVRTGVIQGFILPAPSAVIISLFVNFKEIAPHMWETFWVCFVGLSISILLAFIIAVIMDGITIFKKTVYPLLIASQTIPIMVITPLIILMLGYGLAPRLLVVVLVCFFPVCISLYDGLSSVDPDMLMLMKSMKADKKGIFWHVKFPASLPSLFSGIRISATYCVMATVIAEWQGSNTGLGIYMIRVKRSYNYDKMFAAIVLIVLMSLLFFLAAQFVQKKAIRWKK